MPTQSEPSGEAASAVIELAGRLVLSLVNTRQTLVGAQPEVAVSGLGDGFDGVLGQSVLLSPHVARILGQRLVRIESPRTAGQAPGDQTRPHHANSQPAIVPHLYLHGYQSV